MTKDEYLLQIKQRFPNEEIEILSFVAGNKPITYQCCRCKKIYKQNRATGVYDKKSLCSCYYKIETTLMRQENFLREVQRRFPEQEIIILEFFETHSPIRYQCKNCQKEYYLSVAKSLYRKTSVCPDCYPHIKNSKYRDIIKTFISNSQQFDFYEPWDEKISKTSFIPIICHKCGMKQKKRASAFVRAREETLCYYCGKNSHPISLAEYRQRMIECDKQDYDIINYTRLKAMATYRHNCGFVFSQSADNFLLGNGCPECFGRRSKGEMKIEKFLKENNVRYEKEKRFDFNFRSPFDFFLPEYNVLIEFQGEQHFRSVSYFGGAKSFERQKANDENKRRFCQERGYILIAIPYTDYDKIEEYLSPYRSTTIPEGSSGFAAK